MAGMALRLPQQRSFVPAIDILESIFCSELETRFLNRFKGLFVAPDLIQLKG